MRGGNEQIVTLRKHCLQSPKQYEIREFVIHKVKMSDSNLFKGVGYCTLSHSLYSINFHGGPRPFVCFVT